MEVGGGRSLSPKQQDNLLDMQEIEVTQKVGVWGTTLSDQVKFSMTNDGI